MIGAGAAEQELVEQPLSQLEAVEQQRRLWNSFLKKPLPKSFLRAQGSQAEAQAEAGPAAQQADGAEQAGLQ
ncbi:MAG: hypothetical protein K8T89_26200, partial [Planctomycetes bacterium]|nr:hypothetical protein [Planctomycetota bacterium]